MITGLSAGQHELLGRRPRRRLRTGLFGEGDRRPALSVQGIDTVHGPVQRPRRVASTCRPRAAAPSARSCSSARAGGVELLRDAVRGDRPEAASRAGGLVERRLRRRDCCRRAHRRSGRRHAAGARGDPAARDEVWGDTSRVERGCGSCSTWAEWSSPPAGCSCSRGCLGGGLGDRVRGLHGHARRRPARSPARMLSAPRPRCRCRVQAVRVVEGLLRLPFGLATVRA